MNPQESWHRSEGRRRRGNGTVRCNRRNKTFHRNPSNPETWRPSKVPDRSVVSGHHVLRTEFPDKFAATIAKVAHGRQRYLTIVGLHAYS